MTTDNQQLTIQADKKLRKQVIIGILLFIPVGGFLIHLILTYFEECMLLMGTDTELGISRLRSLLTILAIVNGFISLAFAIYFISLAMKIHQSGCYPPKGMRVIKDARVLTGKEAKAMAVFHIFIAILALSSNILIGYIYVILDKLN